MKAKLVNESLSSYINEAKKPVKPVKPVKKPIKKSLKESMNIYNNPSAEKLKKLNMEFGRIWNRLDSYSQDKLGVEADQMGLVSYEADQGQPIPIELTFAPLEGVSSERIIWNEADLENPDIEEYLIMTFGNNEDEETYYDVETFDDPVSEAIEGGIQTHLAAIELANKYI